MQTFKEYIENTQESFMPFYDPIHSDLNKLARKYQKTDMNIAQALQDLWYGKGFFEGKSIKDAIKYYTSDKSMT